MIRLTRLNNRPFAVNSDLIKFVENAPDTVITLTNGEKVVVKESLDTVIEQMIEFKRIVSSNSPISLTTPASPSVSEATEERG